jgi:DNA-binding XRE family transcriptional regulator
MADYILPEGKQRLCKIMASNLSTLRAKANMTQDELADRLGLSRQTISAIENGKREMLWSTFSVLVMFFAKNEEIIQLMVVMGVLNDDVGKIFNINARES